MLKEILLSIGLDVGPFVLTTCIAASLVIGFFIWVIIDKLIKKINKK